MTIKELIEKLKEYPEDMYVRVSATYDYGFGCAGGEVQYIEKDRLEYAVVLCNDEGWPHKTTILKEQKYEYWRLCMQ